jgi:aminoglycoside phosphotransferase (APT) family kinase protein
MINTLKLFEALTSAALPEPQARAIVEAIGWAIDEHESRQAKDLADKVDAGRMDAEVHRIETSLGQTIREIRAEFRGEFAQVRAEMSQLRTELKSEMAQLEARVETRIAQSQAAMIRWMFIFWVGQVAAMKFLR